MENDQEDLDLLLSLDDRVLETPPGSPSAAPGELLSLTFLGFCFLKSIVRRFRFVFLIRSITCVIDLMIRILIWVRLVSTKFSQISVKFDAFRYFNP